VIASTKLNTISLSYIVNLFIILSFIDMLIKNRSQVYIIIDAGITICLQL
jgi:hypothetical protein